MPIRIGTRASPLARWQAEWVADQLAARRPCRRARADHHSGRHRPRQPDRRHRHHRRIHQRIATGTARRADRRGRSQPEGSADRRSRRGWRWPPCRRANRPSTRLSAAILPRRLTRSQSARSIGTGSLRRQAQLLHLRPDLKMMPIRGNVETRLRKLAERRVRCARSGRGRSEAAWIRGSDHRAARAAAISPRGRARGAGTRNSRGRLRSCRIVASLDDPAFSRRRRRGAGVPGGDAGRLFGADRRLRPNRRSRPTPTRRRRAYLRRYAADRRQVCRVVRERRLSWDIGWPMNSNKQARGSLVRRGRGI